jgi:hypothetical protein
MNHDGHEDVMNDLYEKEKTDKISKDAKPTAKNMNSNYVVISKRLDREFKSPLPNKHKFERFVYYFMHRLVMVNLDVEQTDCPMIFEVINDRGIKLEPHEILKGKLLGQVSNEDKRLELNSLWEERLQKINDTFNSNKDDGDKKDKKNDFFVDLLKARYANNANRASEYNDKNYHRKIFSEVNPLGLVHNSDAVVTFLTKDFEYYTNLYTKILKHCCVKRLTDISETDEGFEYVYYNKLNGIDDIQFHLILSSCSSNDTEIEVVDSKIKTIAREFDRLYCLLHLQNRNFKYKGDSKAIYELILSIHDVDMDISVIRDKFDKTITDILYKEQGGQIKPPFKPSWSLFKGMGHDDLNKRFMRYFFARIEKFIADSFRDKRPIKDFEMLVNNQSYNIVHILGDRYISLFSNEENFDREKQRLGGLLLLGNSAAKHSEDDAPYSVKLRDSYAKSKLFWNQTLCKDCYPPNDNFSGLEDKKLHVHWMNKFGPEELEKRHKLLFEMVKHIWK